MTPDDLRTHFPALAARLPDEETAALCAALRPRRVPAGSRLATYGEPASCLHLVLSGAISVHVEKDGEDLLLGQATAGSIVGEVGLIEPGPASATLEALEDSETLDLEHERFESLCSEHPAAASALLRALSLELVERLRASSHEIVRQIDDHHWMRVRAREERHGWRDRIAALIRGRGDDASSAREQHR